MEEIYEKLMVFRAYSGIRNAIIRDFSKFGLRLRSPTRTGGDRKPP